MLAEAQGTAVQTALQPRCALATLRNAAGLLPPQEQEQGSKPQGKGEDDEGDGCSPQGRNMPLHPHRSLRRDHVGEVQHVAQRPADISAPCLPEEKGDDELALQESHTDDIGPPTPAWPKLGAVTGPTPSATLGRGPGPAFWTVALTTPQRGNLALFPSAASTPACRLGLLPTFIWKKMLFQLVSLNL